ncbi:MAG: hypothetical protein AAGA97_00560 [Pseudomonadota bacterium]
MNSEDQKRLQREADIANSVRGPDYTRLKQSIRQAKEEATKAAEFRVETEKRKSLRSMDIGEL